MPSSTKIPQVASNQLTKNSFDSLPDSAFLRVSQLVLPPNAPSDFFAILPFSAASLWRKSKKEKTFPAPLKISSGITAWRVGDVRRWLNEQKQQ